MNPSAAATSPRTRPARWLQPALAEIPGDWDIPSIVAKILWKRGLRTRTEVRRFMEPSLDDLHDPMLMAGMKDAVARLLLAIEGQEKVLLYGDYDVDGITSVVILKTALRLAGLNASFHVPHRLKDGYGMHAEVIEQAAADGVKLIISVDTGIRATAVVKQAGVLGIDCIVTDHHLPEEELPPAVAVLNPNRLDCPYPEKNLCGAGVTLKLVQALHEALGWDAARRQKILLSLLKLAAVATVADVVPLEGENRIIVKHGLADLAATRNPGLRALLQVAGFEPNQSPSAGQVAFRIAPRINAAGRMANAADAIEMFLTADEARAFALAEQLNVLNTERQQTEQEIIAAIVRECEQVPVTDESHALVFAGENWHKGVVGIVASRMVDRFHRPAFVLSIDTETGKVQGSGRSAVNFHLLQGLESMADLFVKFGGHKQAAGLTLEANNLEEFRRRFQLVAASQLSAEDFRKTYEIDAMVSLDELDDPTATALLSMAPFGMGNPAPLLAALQAEVASPGEVFAEKHLRVKLRRNGRVMTMKAWDMGHRAAELQPGMKIDVAFTVEEDPYSASRGYSFWSATIKDFRV